MTLATPQIERAVLPKSDQRNRPDPVPAILLGRLAVDLAYRGKGCACSLVYFALKTAIAVSEHLSCFGVLTHALNDGVRSFYSRFGFEELPFDPRRGMIARIIDLKHNGF